MYRPEQRQQSLFSLSNPIRGDRDVDDDKRERASIEMEGRGREQAGWLLRRPASGTAAA